jgi:type I restriction enzyme R subunit
VITDAIRDQNVCAFWENMGKYKNKSNAFIDIDVEEIDKQEVLNSERESIKSSIISLPHQKTFNKDYSACCKAVLITMSSITTYSKEERSRIHDLRIATIFTYGSNEDSDEANDSLQMMNKRIRLGGRTKSHL